MAVKIQDLKPCFLDCGSVQCYGRIPKFRRTLVSP